MQQILTPHGQKGGGSPADSGRRTSAPGRVPRTTEGIAEMVSFVSKVCNLSLYFKDVGSTDYAMDFWQENVSMYSLFAVGLLGLLLSSTSVFLLLTGRGVDCMMVKS